MGNSVDETIKEVDETIKGREESVVKKEEVDETIEGQEELQQKLKQDLQDLQELQGELQQLNDEVMRLATKELKFKLALTEHVKNLRKQLDGLSGDGSIDVTSALGFNVIEPLAKDLGTMSKNPKYSEIRRETEREGKELADLAVKISVNDQCDEDCMETILEEVPKISILGISPQDWRKRLTKAMLESIASRMSTGRFPVSKKKTRE